MEQRGNEFVRWYDTFGELTYELFSEIGLGINAQTSYVYDQETGAPIMFGEKYIKANYNDQPIYSGRTDVAFDPSTNYRLMNTLFGFYLDKLQHSEDGDMLGGYIAHYIDDNEDKTKQRIVVKTGRGEIASRYYWNIYLAYIDCILRIGGANVDLSNFDPPREEEK